MKLQLTKIISKRRLSDVAVGGATLTFAFLFAKIGHMSDPCNFAVNFPPIQAQGGLSAGDCRSFMDAGLKAAVKAGKKEQADLLYLVLGLGAPSRRQLRAPPPRRPPRPLPPRADARAALACAHTAVRIEGAFFLAVALTGAYALGVKPGAPRGLLHFALGTIFSLMALIDASTGARAPA